MNRIFTGIFMIVAFLLVVFAAIDRVWACEQNPYPPVAVIAEDPAYACVGTTVNFDGSGSYDSDGTIEEYLWIFPKGASEISQDDPNASCTFDSAGTYLVRLKVRDDDDLWSEDMEYCQVYVVEVASLDPSTGAELFDDEGDPDTRMFAVLNEGGDITVTAESNPVVSESNLPDCWDLTGGSVQDNLTTLVDRDDPNTEVVCSANSSSKTVIIYSSGDDDGDDMPNDWEAHYDLDGNDPNDADDDLDEDGLTNLAEYESGTNPDNVDTDKDGMPDGWEIDEGFDPLDPADADEDFDSDGYTNLSEFLHGDSDPGDPNDPNEPPYTINIYVPGNAISIQSAIKASIDGDEIEVAEGTYCETINFEGKSITLQSSDPDDWDAIEATIIDPNATGSAVTFANNEDSNSQLVGFTITDGYAGLADTDMAAYWRLDESSGTVAFDSTDNDYDGTISGNPTWQPTGGRMGGALEFDGTGDYVEIEGYKGVTGDLPRTVTAWVRVEPNASGTIVRWGTSNISGATWSNVINADGKLRVAVWGGTVTGDTDIDDDTWHHVAIVLPDKKNVKVEDILLYVDGDQEDTTLTYGTQTIETAVGIDALISYGGSFNGLLDDVRIYDWALSGDDVRRLYEIDGGGIYCQSSDPTISMCVIKDNYAERNGAGIYCYDGSADLANCLIYDNEAGYYGGGISNETSSPAIANITLSGNTAYRGGGLDNDYGSEPLITNAILWGNTASGSGNEVSNSGSSAPSFSYSDIDGCGGSGSWDSDFGTDGGGNIDSDPLFVDDSNDDYHLLTYSPCVDAGDPTSDYSNEPEDNGDRINMGAYGNTTDAAVSDGDGDGMPDIWEVEYGLDPDDPDDAGLDPDNDGLTNLNEYNNGTYPNDSDSDNDGMPDGWEVQYGLNPLDDDADEDPDGDNLNNLGEYNNSCDPNDSDSDGDDLPDGWEVQYGLDPLDDNANEDPDDDDLDNLEEYNNGSCPNDSDSDNDGMPDGWEVRNNLDPSDDSDASEDILDEDDLVNLDEYNNGTNPNDSDTDNDLMPDGWEVQYGLNPLDNDDADEDADSDGLTNLYEYNNDIYPNDSDSDNDGMLDGWEVDEGFDPLDLDDADEDFDEDNYTNLSEFLHDETDPNDPNSYPTSNITIYVPANAISIQSAINASIDGDVIEVAEGTYVENVDFDGKNITLTSTDPYDWDVVAATIIDPSSGCGVELIDGEDDAVLQGFTVSGASSSVNVNNVDAKIQWCIIENNTSYGIYAANCACEITNCKIRDNGTDGIFIYGSEAGLAITNSWIYDNGDAGLCTVFSNAACEFRNNTVCGNDDYGVVVPGATGGLVTITNCILWDNDDDLSNCSAMYSCIEDGDGVSDPNNHNIDDNPLFVDDPNSDYHLTMDSPCIDTGDPGGSYGGQVDIDSDVRVCGDYVDMGADEFYPVHNTTRKLWYATIQDAIEEAVDGDTIVIAKGIYQEAIDFGHRAINLASTDPNDPDVVADTIIDPNDSYQTVVVFGRTEGDNNPTLSGLTITGGMAGISCDVNSSPEISRCIISNNDTAGIHSVQASPTISYCVITNNNHGLMYFISGYYSSMVTVTNSVIADNTEAGVTTGSAVGITNGSLAITNCTIAGNGEYGLYKVVGDVTVSNSIIWGNEDNLYLSDGEIAYSCIEGEELGGTNISNYPHFDDPDNGDYHLASWSPCIDAGDPNSDYSNEPGSGGGRINMGAYGNTSEAALASEDEDEDGLPDDWELLYWPGDDPNQHDPEDDPDSDDLDNEQEYQFGSDPNDSDSDDDGMPDGWEYDYNLDPLDDDADGDPDEDELSNLGEYTNLCEPNDSDSDDDGMLDGWEVDNNLDPTDPDDVDDDDDSDDLTNLEEYQAGTDPADSDSDDDNIPDGWEVQYGLDPTDDSDADEDADSDGLANYGEYSNSSSPNDSDSDDDGMADGWEVDNWLDPVNPNDAELDLDTDDYSNIVEFLHDSDPNDSNDLPQAITITVPTEIGSIQQAIDWSIDGDIIKVSRGTYVENVDFDGKNITLTGINPDSWDVTAATIIDPNDTDSGSYGVEFSGGEDSNAVLAGLTIRRAYNGVYVGGADPVIKNCIIKESCYGIYCDSSSPTITNNKIIDNDNEGIYVYDTGSVPVIKNNWIYDNETGIEFDSVTSAATVRNNTIVYNSDAGIYVDSDPNTVAPNISNCILWNPSGDDLNGCSATYSCIYDGDAGDYNISSYPYFVDAPKDDFCIDRDSSCKGAGDPNGTYTGETDINGQVREVHTVDIGADEVCEVHNTVADEWYTGIQDAIDDADPNDVIMVYEWTFEENIDFDGLAITLTSTNPESWQVMENTIISAYAPNDPVVTFESGEDNNSVLTGFTLRDSDYGVYCDNSSSPSIIRCIIRNNTEGIYCNSGAPLIARNVICYNGDDSGDGAAIVSNSSTPPTIRSNWIYDNDSGIEFTGATSAAAVYNNTIADNYRLDPNYPEAVGIYVDPNSTEPDVANCILRGNDDDLDGCSVTYSCVVDPSDLGDPNSTHNFDSDPKFSPDSDNYSLLAESACVLSGNTSIVGSGDLNLNGEPLIVDSGGETTTCSGAVVGIPWFVDDDSEYSSNPNYNDSYDDPSWGTSWDTAFRYLQDALKNPNLNKGDYIMVAGGTYYPDEGMGITERDQNETFHLISEITIYGGFAGDPEDPTEDLFNELFDLDARDFATNETILSGDLDGNNEPDNNSYLVVVVGYDTVIDGFTIEYGYGGYGGGLYIAPTSPTVRECVFRKNRALYGGAVCCEDGSSATFINCLFTENISTTTSGYGGGGAVDLFCCRTPTFSHCIFRGNEAASAGGGMRSEASGPVLNNCIFEGNTAANGGAIYRIGGYVGAGELTNCILNSNSASECGGGIYHNGSSVGEFNQTNCTFIGNSAGEEGGGMYNTNSAEPTITNCIFWDDEASVSGNEIYNDGTSCPIISYCDIEGCGGTGDGWDDDLGTDGGGNIGSDPCFIDADGDDDIPGNADDDLHLQTYSPCVDTGDPTSDYSNEPPPSGGRINMGAYGNTDEAAVGDGDEDGDGDGLPDIWEWQYRPYLDIYADDAIEDPDEDGLNNMEEYNNSTDPTKSDSDGDGLPDGWEVEYGLDPLDDGTVDEDNGATGNPDGDDLTNLEEYQKGFNPTLPNNDGDPVTASEYDDASGVIKKQGQYEVRDGEVVCLSETRYDYDKLGRQWRTRQLADPASGTDNTKDMITITTYDVMGNVKKTAQKATEGSGYDNPDIIASCDIVTENVYSSGKLTKTIDPEGNQTEYKYDSNGRLYQVVQLNNPAASGDDVTITTNEYDAAGRLEKVTDAEGNYHGYTFDSLGHTIKEIAYDDTSTALMQIRSEYDGMGHVTRQAVMADATTLDTTSIDTTEDMVTDYGYDSNDDDYPGMLTSQTVYYGGDPASEATTTYHYDGLGRQDTIVDPLGNETQLTYNAVDQITQRRQVNDDPLGEDDQVITTDYVFDPLGRMIEERALPDPDDPDTYLATEYKYDGRGNLVKKTDPKEIVTTYAYNALGRQTEMVVDVGGGGIEQKTKWTYDRLGRQDSIIGYANGTTAQTTQYDYDKLGRVKIITYPDNEKIEYGYEGDGTYDNYGRSPDARTDQRGWVTAYTYDYLGRLEVKSITVDSVTTTETFTYDGLSRMLTAEKEVDSSAISFTEFTYNDLGKVNYTDETILGGSEVNIDYDYDQAGNLTQITYPDSYAVDIMPDPLGRIDTITVDSTDVVTYKYLGSKMFQRNYPEPDVTYDIEYNDLGQATRHYTYKNGTPADTTITDFGYIFDDNGNITDQSFDHRGSTPTPYNEYTYDNLDRVTQAEYLVGVQTVDEEFIYDDLGNRTSVELRDDNTETYAVNNLTNRYNETTGGPYDIELEYDDAGNMTTDHNNYEYLYDYENRLVKITDGVYNIAEYTYDALGRRIEMKVYDNGEVDSVTRYYYNNNWQVLAETDYDSTGPTETQLRDYIYGNYIDEVLIMTDDSDAEHYYGHDHIFSVVALIEDDGDVEERYEYDAYGKPEISNADFTQTYDASQFGNPYMFTSRRVDSLDTDDLQLQYNRNRYLDYHTGRWLTQDPLGVTPNGYLGNSTLKPKKQYEYGTNLYEYVKSIPSILIDPFGLWHYDVEDPVKRSMQSRTLVLPDDGESPYDIVGLAQFVRLDTREFSKWAIFKESKCGYTVPNTAYVNKGSVTGNLFWRWFETKSRNLFNLAIEGELDDIEGHFKELGYRVSRKTDVNWQEIDSQVRSADIIAWAFGGHGYDGSLVLFDDSVYGSHQALRVLHHKLAEVILYTCEAFKDPDWRKMVSPNGGIVCGTSSTFRPITTDWEDLLAVPGFD